MLAFLAALALQPRKRRAPPSGWGGMPAAAATKVWPTREGDVVLEEFPLPRRRSAAASCGCTIRRSGTPHRNAPGKIDNAVMVLHGTGGDGKQFLRPQFADELYGPGQPLDIRKYWIILPDNIGHGKSSKPSDGLRMRFPKYDYDDMVEAQHRMLQRPRRHASAADLRHVDGLHARLRVGRNASDVRQRADADGVRADRDRRAQPDVAPAGDQRDRGGPGVAERQLSYASRRTGLRTAEILLFVAGSAPLYYQAQYPTRAGRERLRRGAGRDRACKELDANDLIYQLDASRNYNPWPRLEAITAPMMWINSADDFINPRNLPLSADAR